MARRDALTSEPETEPLQALQQLLSMTDEEKDIEDFRAYVRVLPPDSLYDVLGHLDTERYPRRVEYVRREIGRRRLFFISPYTDFEHKLRTIFGVSVSFALIAALLRAIGSFDIPLEPGEHLTWFYDLAVGGPPAARMLLPIARFALILGSVSTAVCILASLWHLARRRLRRDVLFLGLGCAILIALCARLAGVI